MWNLEGLRQIVAGGDRRGRIESPTEIIIKFFSHSVAAASEIDENDDEEEAIEIKWNFKPRLSKFY